MSKIESNEHKKLDHPYLAVIPYNILSDKNITDGAKLHFCYLSALAKNEGYCWATNQQLAEVQGKSAKTISGYNTELKNSGHIEIEENHIPYRTEEERLLWKNRKKIYVDLAFVRKEVIKKESPKVDIKTISEITTAPKTLLSIDSAENVTPLSIKDKYKKSIEDDFLKKETLNTKQNTELKAKMEEAGLDNSAINFSKKYSDEKIEIALHKLKQYKPNKPSGYFIGLLKDEDLKQTESKEEIADKNKAKAEEVLKKYRGKKFNGYTIQGDVLSQHFEIGVGGCNGMNVFEYTDNNFDEKLDEYLNCIDVYIES